MLPLAFRRAHGTPYGTVEAPELALGARIHVAHAAHDGMRLVVQVQAVADQLLQLDFRRAFGTAAIESAALTAISAISTAIPGRSPRGRSPPGPDPRGAPCAPRPSRGRRFPFRCSCCSSAMC